MSDEKSKKRRNNLLAAGLGGAAGAAAFAATRKPKALPNTKELKKAKEIFQDKGKITIVDEYPFNFSNAGRNMDLWKKKPLKEKIKNPENFVFDVSGKLYRKLRYGLNKNIDLVRPKNVKDGQKFDGVVINQSGKKIKGDYTIKNTARGESSSFKDYVNKDIKAGRSDNLQDYLIPSDSVKNLGITKNTPDKEIQKIIDKHPNSYIKPKHGQQSKGLYTETEKLKDFSYEGKSGYDLVREGVKNDDLLIQPKLDIKNELRFHTLNGKVIDKPTTRHGVAKGRKAGFGDFPVKEFEKKLQKDLKQRGIKDKNSVIGFDLAETADGKYKIIEGNSDSGRFFNFINPIDSKEPYYKITGAKTMATPVAAAAVGGGATAAGSKKILDEIEKKRNKEAMLKQAKDKKLDLNRDEKRVLKGLAMGGAAVGAGYGGSKAFHYIKDNTTLYRNINKIIDDYPEKVSPEARELYEQLTKNAALSEKQKDALTGGAAVGTGAGLGAYIDHKKGYSPKEYKRFQNAQSATSKNTGLIPIDPKDVKELASQAKQEALNFTRESEETLGNYLRGKSKRPVFGDDSELQMLVNKGNQMLAGNIYGDDSQTKVPAVDADDYKLIRDQTAGGIEISVNPGNADELHERVGKAVTEGYDKLKKPKNSVLVNSSFLNTTKEGVGLGGSSHLHFQAKPEKMDSAIKRMVGATAPLNYLVPGGDKRAKGYKSHGTLQGATFGKKLPQARVWAKDGEDDLAKKTDLGYTSQKAKSWQPDPGHVATEVRFNSAMHGDPQLSKKFFELSELAVSGDEKYGKQLEELGDFVVNKTKGENAKNLYNPDVKKEVITRFKDIVQNSDFKNDSVLNQMIDAAEKGKKMNLKDATKAWKTVR